jgi:hypothetical protein
MMTRHPRKVDEQALELAREMEEASYQVRRALTNAEPSEVVAALQAEHAAARQRYVDYKAGN